MDFTQVFGEVQAIQKEDTVEMIDLVLYRRGSDAIYREYPNVVSCRLAKALAETWD